MSVGAASTGGGPTSSAGWSAIGSGGGDAGPMLIFICAYPNDAARQTETKTKIFTKFLILLPLSVRYSFLNEVREADTYGTIGPFVLHLSEFDGKLSNSSNPAPTNTPG